MVTTPASRGWTIGPSLYPAEHTGELVITEYGSDNAAADSGTAIPTRKKTRIRPGVPPDVFGARKLKRRK